MSGRIECPSCGSAEHRVFYEVPNVPVHSCIMFAAEEAAREFPKGRIEAAVCRSCGFVWNAAFDPSVQDYSPLYEDQQCYSATFNAFARRLARRIIEKYGIRNKNIVEIGCGKGDFLAMMCEMGNNRGVGIDPSCEKERINGPAAGRITVIQDYYSEKYSRYTGDLVMCRHTLEHIHETRKFVETVRRGIGRRRDTVVFFEIPDVTIVLDNLVFWDIYYEHCSYFSPGSLGRLFRSCGFEVLDLYVDFDDQYLMIEASPADARQPTPHPREEPASEIAAKVDRFAARVGEQKERWLRLVREKHVSGNRPVIWGSGSKCVAFLTTLGIDTEIGRVVDINPRRHGKFIAGTAKRIDPPECLKDYRPGTIIAMNPIYKEEIAAMASRMGLGAEVIAV